MNRRDFFKMLFCIHLFKSEISNPHWGSIRPNKRTYNAFLFSLLPNSKTKSKMHEMGITYDPCFGVNASEAINALELLSSIGADSDTKIPSKVAKVYNI